ncbi:MAG: hypothetical protein ACSHXI_16440 [Hoeflea sp.]|uniref:hypothetical protein n=1 Tax=Hoeflea sp. TaxID=1940281 RepID=UPI003EF15908
MTSQPFNLSNQIRQTFKLASLRHEAAKNLRGEDQVAYSKVVMAYAEQRKSEIQTYQNEYQTRVEVERKRLIDKAGEKNKTFQHRWFGADKFDKAAITRQAHRNVRQDHESTLARLDRQETETVDGLLEKAGHREALREKPMRDFQKAVDRRQGQDRRKPRVR